MKQSLVRNAVYNMIYQLLSTLFPLISAGYVARIVAPEGVGTVASAQNVVSYFTMIAALGISAYGTREIARVGYDPDRMNRLFSELLTLNGIFTAAALIGYGMLIAVCFPDSLLLYAAVGLELVFNFINIDWFYQGREEYGYITTRSLFVKIISLAALFLFVKQKQDYILYALIHSLGVGCNYCFNMVHARKKVSLVFRELNLGKHIKAIAYLTLSIVAGSIYNKVDITMLGILTDASAVAFYTNSHKVMGIILALVTSVSAVFLPRLSSCYQSDRKKYDAYLSEGLKIVLLLALPSCIGIVLVAEDMMLVLFGESFVPAANVLRILAVFTIIKGVGDILCYQTIVSSGNEKMLIPARLAAGIANIILNAIMIPLYGSNGAAIASVAAELVVNGILLWRVRSTTNIHVHKQYCLSICFSGVGMGVIVAMIRQYLTSNMFALATSALAGILSYGLLLAVSHNEVICKILLWRKKRRNFGEE